MFAQPPVRSEQRPAAGSSGATVESFDFKNQREGIHVVIQTRLIRQVGCFHGKIVFCHCKLRVKPSDCELFAVRVSDVLDAGF